MLTDSKRGPHRPFPSDLPSFDFSSSFALISCVNAMSASPCGGERERGGKGQVWGWRFPLPPLQMTLLLLLQCGHRGGLGA